MIATCFLNCMLSLYRLLLGITTFCVLDFLRVTCNCDLKYRVCINGCRYFHKGLAKSETFGENNRKTVKIARLL